MEYECVAITLDKKIAVMLVTGGIFINWSYQPYRRVSDDLYENLSTKNPNNMHLFTTIKAALEFAEKAAWALE